MKKAWKIIGGIVIAILLMIGLVFWKTSGVSDAADAVISQLNAGNIEAVYNDSAMTTSFDLEYFKQAVWYGTDADITKAVNLSWNGRGFENGEYYIYGEFELPNGATQTITYRFVKDEAGAYKFLGVTWGEPDTDMD